IVMASSFVPEGPNEPPRKPSGRLHSHERTALGGGVENLVEGLLIEFLFWAKVALRPETGCELEERRPKIHNLFARRVKPDRVICGGADHTGGARSLGLTPGVRLEHV